MLIQQIIEFELRDLVPMVGLYSTPKTGWIVQYS